MLTSDTYTTFRFSMKSTLQNSSKLEISREDSSAINIKETITNYYSTAERLWPKATSPFTWSPCINNTVNNSQASGGWIKSRLSPLQPLTSWDLMLINPVSQPTVEWRHYIKYWKRNINYVSPRGELHHLEDMEHTFSKNDWQMKYMEKSKWMNSSVNVMAYYVNLRGWRGFVGLTQKLIKKKILGVFPAKQVQ